MLRLEQFEKRYGEILAVQATDLEIRAGEIFVLLGSNGSGKSTILRAVCGLHAPTSGRVFVDGFDVSTDALAVRRRLAYLPQRLTLPGLLTAREILALYAGLCGAGPERIAAALEELGLADDADRAIGEYSGGMMQRLGLAVTYLRDVDLLLLDEPTLNLDPAGTERFHDWLRRQNDGGATVLFTSHILHEALHLADRVGVMAGGRLVQVEEVGAFRDRVLGATRVRVVLDRLDDDVVAAAAEAGAQSPTIVETSYAFKAPPEKRLKVIRAIEQAGALIEELHTEAPGWEALAGNHFEDDGGNDAD
jgi:ABC-type multidrug transport system ATPase subunit